MRMLRRTDAFPTEWHFVDETVKLCCLQLCVEMSRINNPFQHSDNAAMLSSEAAEGAAVHEAVIIHH
jgi:hypothetical protein